MKHEKKLERSSFEIRPSTIPNDKHIPQALAQYLVDHTVQESRHIEIRKHNTVQTLARLKPEKKKNTEESNTAEGVIAGKQLL